MNQNRKQQLEDAEKASGLNVTVTIILLFLFLVLFVRNAHSQTVYVNQAVAGGANDGTTWADAYPSLQTAIENATAGEQIWVAAGTYKPNVYPIGTTDGSSERDYAFTLRNNIAIYGGFAGGELSLSARNFVTHPTILSGDIGIAGNSNDNCYHVVLGDYINSSAILDGFTITRGNASEIIITTHTPSGHILPAHSGAGIFLNFASPQINNCIITDNTALYTGGGVLAQGTSNEIFTNCVFVNNNVSSTIFGGGGLYSNAIPSARSNPTLINCVFNGNTSQGAGGAVYTQYSNATIINCTVYNNTAQYWGGGIYNEDSSTMIVTNSVIWGNTGMSRAGLNNDAGLTWNALQPTVTYSDLQSVVSGVGNISADPQFINSSSPRGSDGSWMSNDDGLRLSNCSPAVDVATATGAPATDIISTSRPQGAGYDMGAYETTGTGGGSTRLYVDGSASAGGNGSSWAMALNSLETALNLAGSSSCVHEVWVKEGTYYPSHQYSAFTGNDTTGNTRQQTFKIPDGIAVYGSFSGTESVLSERPTTLNTTILNGDIGALNDSTDNCYHVVSFINAAGSSTRLDGFTVMGGNASELFGSYSTGGGIFNTARGAGNICNATIANCTVRNNSAERFGGGLTVLGVAYGSNSPAIINCLFVNNVADSATNAGGGGLYFEGNTYGVCNPVLTNCTISNNTASYGGGLSISHNSHASLSNCVFTNNIAKNNGGAIECSTYNGDPGCTPFYNNCTFNANKALRNGGAVSNYSAGGLCIPNFTNCVFNNNIAANWGGAFHNSSVNNNICSPVIEHCTFNLDSAIAGGAIFNNSTNTGSQCNPLINNCTFIRNYASVNGGAINNDANVNGTCNPSISKCFFIRNTALSAAGAILNYGNSGTCNPTVTNTVFGFNTANDGGAMFNWTAGSGTSSPSILNCTFNANTSSGSSLSGGLANYRGGSTCNPQIKNSILWNSPINNYGSGANPTISFSNIQDSHGSGASWASSNGIDGGGNIDTDPLFRNAAYPDGDDAIYYTTDDGLSLHGHSPCVNTGTNTGAPATDITGFARPFGGTVDMGAYEENYITVTTSATVGGTISPLGVNRVTVGDDFHFQIRPNPGYCSGNATYDDVSDYFYFGDAHYPDERNFFIMNVVSSHTLIAHFTREVIPSVRLTVNRITACTDAPLIFTATPTNGGTAPLYNYYVDGVLAGGSASAVFSTATLTPGAHQVYFVMFPNNVCQTVFSTPSNVLNVVVYAPTVLAPITGVLTGCSIGGLTTLFNTTPAGVWSSSNPAVATINATNGRVVALSAGISTMTYTYTNPGGCVSAVSVAYTVAPVIVPVIGGAGSVCLDATIALTGTPVGGIWYSNNSRVSVSSTGIVTGRSAVAEPGSVSYKITNAMGCSAIATATIPVNPSPASPFILAVPGIGTTVCNNRTFLLFGSPAGIWSLSAGSGSVATITPTTVSPTATLRTVGLGIATLNYTVTNVFGCSNSRSFTGTVITCSPRGIEITESDKTNNAISIFPNPAKANSTITINGIDKNEFTNAVITINDIYGHQLSVHKIINENSLKLSIGVLSKGMYMITILTANGKKTEKLMIE